MTCRTCPSVVIPRRAGCAHGYCPNCYLRWKAAGFPDGGPPPPERPWGRVLAARLEDYADLRSWGVSVADAAVRVRVSMRTAERYEARLKAERAATKEGQERAA